MTASPAHNAVALGTGFPQYARMPGEIPTVTLKAGKERSILRRHPWVFSGAVAAATPDPRDGDLVRVTDSAGRTLGSGHYQDRGSIRVRMLTFDDRAVDRSFWQHRLEEAVRLRRTLGLLDSTTTNAFRLIHAEGDSLPGLIVDLYARTAVLQTHSAGMTRSLDEIETALRHALPHRVSAVYASAPADQAPCLRSGEPSEFIQIVENGLQFRVDLIHGQKTGFFLDQREHREQVRRLADGRSVLNAFSYTGGFSVYALAGGATHVTSVDASRSAVAGIDRNLALNGLDPARHRAVVADAMDYLSQLDRAYDLVILDPPAFAKRLTARHQAIQAYRRINEAAIRQVAAGGLILTFSCSQAVDADLFRGAVLAAAIDARRPVRVLRQLRQSADHPVSLFHPEGEYLKGLLLHAP